MLYIAIITYDNTDGPGAKLDKNVSRRRFHMSWTAQEALQIDMEDIGFLMVLVICGCRSDFLNIHNEIFLVVQCNCMEQNLFLAFP